MAKKKKKKVNPKGALLKNNIYRVKGSANIPTSTEASLKRNAAETSASKKQWLMLKK